MPSKLVLPSASVLSSSPPRPCLPRVFTGCMITAAFRTGFPLSSFRIMKFRTAVGSSSLSFCALATPSSAKSDKRQANVHVFIFVNLILRHSNEWDPDGERKKWRRAVLRLAGRSALASSPSPRSRKLHQVAGDAGGVVPGNVAFFQIISEHRYHSQRLDGIEIGDDLAGTFERVLG